VRVATHAEVDFVVSAIVGVAGLKQPTKRCARARSSDWPIRNVWSPLANPLRRGPTPGQAAPSHRQRTQCGASMPWRAMNEVERIWLTASGDHS
jgi:hypothetical protein